MSGIDNSELDSKNITMSVARCKHCYREIAFKDGKPHDVRYLNDSFWLITTPHYFTCPFYVKQRIESKCAWCQFEKGAKAMTLVDLYDYEKCEKHSDPNAEFVWRGKTFRFDRESFAKIVHEEKVEKRRLDKKWKKALGIQRLDETFK